MKTSHVMRGAILVMAGTAFAQVNPLQTPDMQHMQHGAGQSKEQGTQQGGFMQGGMHHAVAKGVALDAKLDAATHTVTLRVGPMTLPANTGHMKMPQPPDVYWTIPLEGWLLAYAPKLVDANGGAVPGRVLHHTAFWNVNRADFLCANKEEHIFGAGGEMNQWQQVPGYGYRVGKGDKIRIETMVHNPTDTSYDKVYLEVTIPYQEAARPQSGQQEAWPQSGQQAGADGNGALAPRNFYPAWMDVTSCGNSAYDLAPGKSEKSGTVTVKYDGALLGVGGHMHDYGKQIVLEDATRKETVAALDANTDDKGQLLGMPVKTFFERGGYKFAAGDVLKITATYDNPTGKILPDGAMGIVVGYFVPADVALVAKLRRAEKTPAKTMAHDMPGMTHDQ